MHLNSRALPIQRNYLRLESIITTQATKFAAQIGDKNMRDANYGAALQRGLAILAIASVPALVIAEEYDIAAESQGRAILIEKGDADYPGSTVRSGQEGWVRASYVLTPDGRAIDTIIMDSSGGPGFESGVVGTLEGSQFEPTTIELPNNVVDFRHEIRRGRDAATSNFIRRTRRIMTHLLNDEIEPAREQADEAYELGGWNLYESTMLWLMLGRIEGAEGNHAGKLEMYKRALAMSNSKAIPREDRIELLEKIFLLQSHFEQYAAARRTANLLEGASGAEDAVGRITARSSEIDRILAEEDTVAAKATIVNPCDCEEGAPLWHYAPARRTFSFDNASGNVERFEARCETHRISGAVEFDKTWTMSPEWGSCRVFVFGVDGATFDFVEHLKEGDLSTADDTAVAMSGHNTD